MHPLGLVGGQDAGFSELSKVPGDVMILGGQPRPRIHDKDDDIRFGNRLLRLFGHFLENAAGGIWLKSAGIYHDELVPALPAIAIVAVTCQAGEVGHDRITRLGETIEKR
jgi:hypothetical protein